MVAGEVSYNGYKLEEFIPQKTSAYISQNDLHIPEMTEGNIWAHFQGNGSRAEIMIEVSRKEKQSGIVPNPDADIYMKAISAEGQKTTLQTDYILKYLCLYIDWRCHEKSYLRWSEKRLTTGELIVGPTKSLFMDEISNGLDSSTTYQIVACLQQLAHITDATIVVALLQPAPETFDLFDDIILMAEGKIVYHGSCSHVLEFFEDCGFRCSERKGVADFLQEVISKKDLAQYWHQTKQSCNYISADMFSKKFKESSFALIWTSLAYYVVGYSPEAGSSAASMFRFVAFVFRTAVASITAGSLFVLFPLCQHGCKWGFRVSPLTYGEVGLALNEFLAPRWQKVEWFYLLNPSLWCFKMCNNKLTPAVTETGFTQKKLQLICDITGAFRPSVLTALMGVSGAGKTTLMDILVGRKTSGTIEGDIRIGGFPKEFVKEVLEIIEFDEMKDCLVGMPSVSGLSTEQRKFLTIDVELVANPSIMFMDEPTTGLDARAAAIVMQAVKNVAETGRTIICTIHQPSIDIFEAFDEAISGVQKIRNNYNPITWMLEITSRSAEAQLCIDLAQVYKNCVLYQNNREHVNRWSTPPPSSKELYFATRFSQNGWGQFKSYLWKQHLSYWRSPSYNLLCFTYMLIASLFFGIQFWDQGRKMRSRCMLHGLMHLLRVTVEVLYLLVQVIAFVIITYPMIGQPSTQSNSQVVDMDVLSNSEPCALNGSDHRCGLCGEPIKV
ncbi:unnamed protein product [Camellia sinensis]